MLVWSCGWRRGLNRSVSWDRVRDLQGEGDVALGMGRDLGEADAFDGGIWGRVSAICKQCSDLNVAFKSTTT